MGFSRQKSVQAPILGKNSNSRQVRWPCILSSLVTAAAWYGHLCKANEMTQELLPFLSRGGKKKLLIVFSDMIFYPRVLQ